MVGLFVAHVQWWSTKTEAPKGLRETNMSFRNYLLVSMNYAIPIVLFQQYFNCMLLSQCQSHWNISFRLYIRQCKKSYYNGKCNWYEYDYLLCYSRSHFVNIFSECAPGVIYTPLQLAPVYLDDTLVRCNLEQVNYRDLITCKMGM